MSAAAQLRSALVARFDTPLGIRPKEDREQISTGIAAIDELASGGIARGTLTEICGVASSGRLSLVFSWLRQVTAKGECCAWIDAAGTFDPTSAAEAGIDLDRVLWVDCGGNAEHALKSADLLIQAGGFHAMVLDMADTPEREVRRIPLASWFRLRHAAERSGTALLLMATRIQAASCSSLQIELRRKSIGWRGLLLRGISILAESRKHYQSRVAGFHIINSPAQGTASRLCGRTVR